MADKTKTKKTESKPILEREYIVPLRKEWLKVPKYKRANKAVKALKQFIARHMKVYDRDLRKIKIDIYLNNEIRFRGMKKPPAKIKVKAKKFDNDIVRVELANIPNAIKYIKMKREKKSLALEKTLDEKKVEEKEVGKEEEIKKEEKEKQEENKEKEETSKQESLDIAKEQAKEQKHTAKLPSPTTKDMGYKRAQRGR